MTETGDEPTARGFTASSMRVVLCHKEARWAPHAKRVPDQLELGLLGDPEVVTLSDLDVFDLTRAVPLDQDVAFLRFASAPSFCSEPGVLLDEVLHTVLVVLVDEDLLRDEAFLSWLNACAEHPSMQSGRHRFVAIARGDESKSRWESLSAHPGLGEYQVLDFSHLGETAERMEWLLLRLLHEILHAAATGTGVPADWRLQIFVSHAKRGGLPVARTLRDLVGQVPWLSGFYDARDIDTRGPWKQQLEEAVTRSVLVALRTDVYDSRPFCQSEMRWADENGVPTVHVDARHGFVHAASRLPFESGPCVRIGDGNLMRVLHVALRLAVRSQVFRRRVSELKRLGVLPSSVAMHMIATAPSPRSVLSACEALKTKAEPRAILYPDGSLPAGDLEAACALAGAFNTRLVSPFQLSAELWEVL